MINKVLNYYNKNYIFLKIINDIKKNGKTNNEEINNGKTNNEKTNNGKTNNEEINNGKTNNEKTNNKEINNGKTNNEEINNGKTNNEKTNNKEINNEKTSVININKKITTELSNYFYSNDIFIDKLNPIFSNDFKDENIKLFFDQYQEFYNILKNKKIKLLLNKINNGMIKYNNSHNDFRNGIKTKIEYYENIKESAEPSKNEFKDKKGKYTQVLPYTDIMFLYFIDLLIIIDYLTFYYE